MVAAKRQRTEYDIAHDSRPYNTARVDVVRECRLVSLKAVRTLYEIMMKKTAKDRDRIGAAVALLDRGFGRPAQALTVEVGTAERDPRTLMELVQEAKRLGALDAEVVDVKPLPATTEAEPVKEGT